MHNLNKQQIDHVTKSIISSGVTYSPLIEELTDHICEEIEEQMEKGLAFSEALASSMAKRNSTQLETINNELLDKVSYSAMIKNYLKLGSRSLIKYKLTSAINLIGLVLGITVFLLIGCYVYNEANFDQFHLNGHNTYRLTTERMSDDGSLSGSAFSGAPWGPEIIASIPEAKDMVRLMKYRLPVAIRSQDGNKQFYEKGLIWADNSFLKIFSFPLVTGDANTALDAPNQVVITQSTARKYFGDKSPVGENIVYENDVTLNVTGVIEDFPVNSHIQADIIGSFSTLGRSFWFNIIDRWNVLYYYTYIQFDDEIKPTEIEEKIDLILANNVKRDMQVSLQPITEIHTSGNLENELNQNTSRSTLSISILISLSILLLSIINYINLSNARAMKRVKEVGVIKAMGSTKSLVFVQFMVESFILALISFVISLGLFFAFLLDFMDFLNVELLIPPLYIVLSTGVVIVFFVTISAGGYTALQMADMNIISALRGKLYNKSSRLGFSLRKGLITFQFMAGIGLIGAALIISDQVNYLLEADTGYSKTNIIEIPLHSENRQKLNTLKNEIKTLSNVGYVAMSSHRMSGDQLYRSVYSTAQSDSLVMGRIHVDFEFINSFEMELVAGRGFSDVLATDTSAFIINESAVRLMGYDNPDKALRTGLTYSAQNESGNYLKTGPIIGVVKDFNFESLHENIGAMVLDIEPARNHFLNLKFVQVQDREVALKQVKEKWGQVFPNEPFNYFYVDDRYLSQYSSETQLRKIVLGFSIISVLISTLGLFGLTYFDTSIRAKEMGLRKVLGASQVSILTIFLKDYFVLIAIGFIMIIPVITWFMNSWLNSFAYHINMTYWSFLIPVVFLTVVVVLTTSFTVVRASSSNPINSLNYE